MPPAGPRWRRAFDTVERAMGGRLETAVQDERFIDVLALTTQVTVEMRRRVERVTRRVLHAANLPAGSDMKRLSEQIGGVDRRLRALEHRLDSLGPSEPGPTRLEPKRRANARQRQSR